MPVINEKYDPAKIEVIKEFLQSSLDQKKPQEFEIFVDAFKVVHRTDDLDKFDLFSNFVRADTRSITVVVYNGASHRNTKYIYHLKEEGHAQGLEGFSIDGKIDQRIQEERNKWEKERLEDKVNQLEGEIKEQDKYIDDLESVIEDMQHNKFNLGKINLGELSSIALEGIIRRNPQLLAKLPGGEALAGVIVDDNLERENGQSNNPNQQQEPESEASFSKKSKTSPTEELSEEDKGFLEFLQQLKTVFGEDDLTKIMTILDLLSQDATQIQPTLDFLNPQNTTNDGSV